MTSHFYSTTACAMINYWPDEVAKLIYAFALQTPATKKKAELLHTLVTPTQINEAQEDSYNLVNEYLAAIAKWQKTLNDIDDKRQKINADAELLSGLIKKYLEAPAAKAPLTELEEQYQELKNQEQNLNQLELQLEHWRTTELNTLKEKWETVWHKHKATYADKLIIKLKKEMPNYRLL